MNEIVETAQALLQQGQTAPTLTFLIDRLSKDRRYAGLVRTLRVVEANYSRTKTQELRGVLSPQDAQRSYNQANDAILGVLELLQTGKTSLEPEKPEPRNWWPLIGGSVLAGVLLALGIWYVSGHKDTPQCPDFESGVPKVLILPFINAGGSQSEVLADVLVRDRIEAISGRNNFPLSVGILKQYDAEKEKPGKAEAETLLQRCDANMVIWGTCLQEAGAPPKVDTRFVIDNKIAGSTGFQAFSSLGDLSNKPDLQFRSIDDAVFSLCSWMAFAMQRDSTAMKWQNKVQEKTLDDRQLLSKMQQ